MTPEQSKRKHSPHRATLFEQALYGGLVNVQCKLSYKTYSGSSSSKKTGLATIWRNTYKGSTLLRPLMLVWSGFEVKLLTRQTITSFYKASRRSLFNFGSIALLWLTVLQTRTFFQAKFGTGLLSYWGVFAFTRMRTGTYFCPWKSRQVLERVHLSADGDQDDHTRRIPM